MYLVWYHLFEWDLIHGGCYSDGTSYYGAEFLVYNLVGCFVLLCVCGCSEVGVGLVEIGYKK